MKITLNFSVYIQYHPTCQCHPRIFYLPFNFANRPQLKLVSVVNLYIPRFNVDSKARYVCVVKQRNEDTMKYVETPCNCKAKSREDLLSAKLDRQN